MNSSLSGSPKVSASRSRPPSVAPLIHDGIRYEQMKTSSTEDLPPGGYVVATVVATGKRLWVSRVYQTVVDPRLETDVQMTFFKSMRFDSDHETLVIKDEKERTFHVDMADGKVH